MLETERNFLSAHRDELLKQYGGKFLVIKGEEVTGAFDTMEEALENATSEHGLNSVLIRRPADADLVISAPALTLGILHADPTHSTGSPGTNTGR